MANKYGIDLGEVYRTAESIKGARTRNRLADLQLKDAEREISERPKREAEARQRQNMLTQARTGAASGDINAQQQLLVLDPEGGAKFLEAVSKMGERRRAQTQKIVDETGRLSAYVLQGESPEEQARRYEVMYQGVSPEVRKTLPAQYDRNFIEVSMAKATAMDKILENPKSVRVGGQDILYKGGREIERADVPQKTGTTGVGGAGGLKSADESLMYRQAAELMGGMFDESGNLRALDPEVRPKVQAIATRATEIFSKGGVTRSRAVSLAKEQIEREEQTQYKEGQRAKDAQGNILVYRSGQWVSE